MRMPSSRRGTIFTMQPHLLAYHAFVLGFSTLSTILLYALNLNELAGFWCWTESNDWHMFTYIILWIGVVVIAASMMCIHIMISRAEAALNVREHRGQVSKKVAAKNRRRWSLIRRLLVVPVSYILLHIPGTIRRTADSTGCTWCAESITLSFIQCCCDPSQGSTNFFLFILLDKQLQAQAMAKFRALRKYMGWGDSAAPSGGGNPAVKKGGEASNEDEEYYDDTTDDDESDDDDLPEKDRFTLTDENGRSTLFNSKPIAVKGAGLAAPAPAPAPGLNPLHDDPLLQSPHDRKRSSSAAIRFDL